MTDGGYNQSRLRVRLEYLLACQEPSLVVKAQRWARDKWAWWWAIKLELAPDARIAFDDLLKLSQLVGTTAIDLRYRSAPGCEAWKYAKYHEPSEAHLYVWLGPVEGDTPPLPQEPLTQAQGIRTTEKP